jgi:hypothetical protein
MPQKRTVSFRLHSLLAERFQQLTAAYFGKVGACFAAAILMFLEADPKTQGEYLKRIYEAEINDEVEDAIAAAKAEQLKKIKSREEGSKSKRS